MPLNNAVYYFYDVAYVSLAFLQEPYRQQIVSKRF